MSRIMHFKQQPKSVYYWDYYILCRLNVAAAMALQRMEYWDGTKDTAVIHAESHNEALEENGQPSTQDTSRWVYKAQDELQWELMGITGEKGTAALLKFLQDDVNYLASRNNPDLRFDRKKQYEFQAERVQEHLNYLTYIISYFQCTKTRLNLVYYAIELLTREQVYIEELSVAHVQNKLAEMRTDPKLPRFLKNELTRDKTLSSQDIGEAIPFRNIAEWRVAKLRNGEWQNCGMETATLRGTRRDSAESTPQESGSNSNNYKHTLQTVITNQQVVEENPPSSSTSQQATATALLSQKEMTLAEDEIAMVLEYRRRQQQTTEVSPQPFEEIPPAAIPPLSKQTEVAAQEDQQHNEEIPEAAEIESEVLRPASDSLLTDEIIVSLYEYKHGGVRYDDESRPYQLQAARALLGLRLPLSVDLLEQIYDECCDKWWCDHFGDLHVSHLIEKEKSHGQRRIVRLLKRIQSRSPVVAAKSNGTAETERLVEWNGRLIPEKQAYHEGYEGGFERFKKGDHPDDDLEATLKRLQAEGKLPVLEEVIHG
jgi:hypothetical protein